MDNAYVEKDIDPTSNPTPPHRGEEVNRHCSQQCQANGVLALGVATQAVHLAAYQYESLQTTIH